jgi:transcriptional regulator with XRE-family HTH domain
MYEAGVPTLSFPDEYREMLRLLRHAREEADLTQVEVARALGRHQSFVSKIESGERRIDPIELLRFAELYGVDMLSLLPKLRPLPGVSARHAKRKDTD